MKKFIIFSAIAAVLLVISFILFAQELELIFSHKYHAEEIGAICTDCHPAGESELASDNLLPDMDGCYTCHDEEEECTYCHKDPDNAIAYPRITEYIAKFSHKQHAQKDVECEACHEGVAESDNIHDKHLPSMQDCMTCHPLTMSADYCYVCHDKSEDLKPADNNLSWNKDHGLASYTDQSSCESCHHENMCLDCHQNDNLDHKVHPLNYEYTHGIHARGNKDNCLTCHEEQAFCMDCHRQRMVMPRTHSRANWSNTTTGGGHARAAKLDLDSCISCHSDTQGDPVCAACHH